MARIVGRTDGVPLFVEEMTKSVLESGLLREEADCYVLDGALPALVIPTTLHASLMARLDRLGPAAKEVAQIGAVLGREFAYELIEPVATRPTGELQAALGQLSEAGLLFCRGAAPHASYLFAPRVAQLRRRVDSSKNRRDDTLFNWAHGQHARCRHGARQRAGGVLSETNSPSTSYKPLRRAI